MPEDGQATTSDATDERPEYYWTWRLMQAGFEVEDAARIRGLPTATIQDHIRLAGIGGLTARGD